MPCKHFAAIFRHFDDVSFSSLCDIYTANPIFNLDGDLFNKSDNTLSCFLNEDNSMEGLGEVEQTDIKLPCEPPSSSLLTGIEASSKKVRELLSKIHNLSFLIQSKECLEVVMETLSSVVEQMTEACPKSGGFVLEKTESKRTGMTELPKRKRRKQRVAKTGTIILIM